MTCWLLKNSKQVTTWHGTDKLINLTLSEHLIEACCWHETHNKQREKHANKGLDWANAPPDKVVTKSLIGDSFKSEPSPCRDKIYKYYIYIF